MTLALYGKSRKRQGGLLLAALLAILGATVGAWLLVSDASATGVTTGNAHLKASHKGSTNPGFETGECPTPPVGKDGWWGWHFVFQSNNTNFATLTATFKNAGVVTSFVSTPSGKHAYVWTPGPDQLVDATATTSGTPTLDTEFNLSHVCDGSTRIVRIYKVTQTNAHPAADFPVSVGGTSAGNIHLDQNQHNGSTYVEKIINFSASSVTENSQPSGWSLNGYKTTAVVDLTSTSCSSTGNPSDASSTISAQPSASNAKNYLVCVQNSYVAPRTVTIAKVRIHTGASAGNAETFGGSISNGDTTSWSQSTPASDGTTGSNYSLDQQSHSIGETLTAGQTTAGWKLIGFKKISGKNASTGCTTTESDYTANASSITVPADGNDYTICVLNKYDPTVYLPDLIATKTNNVSGSILQGENFDWQIVVKNQGNANAVFAQNTQVFVDNLPSGPTYSNLQTTGTTTNLNCGLSSGTISCTASGGSFTLAPNGTFTMAVHVVPAADFVGGLANPAADGKCKVDPTNTSGVVAESNENNNTCSDSVVVTAPQVTMRNLQVCKHVESDSPIGGVFTITVSGQSNFVTGNIAPGADECKSYSVEDGSQVAVTETGTPVGWSSASGYPKVDATGISSTSSNTITVNVGDGTCQANKEEQVIENIAVAPDCAVTLTNKAAQQTKQVIFGKYVCNAYGDVEANEDPTNATYNDIGTHVADLKSPALGSNVAVTPLNDGRTAADCHLEPWDFVLKDGSNLATVTQNIHVGAALTPIDINAASMALALQPTRLRVEEVTQAGYGFAGIKCYNDHLHSDNWEWIDFSEGNGGIPQGDVYCLAYNIPLNRDITVVKNVDNVANDSQTFTVSIDNSQSGSIAETDVIHLTKSVSTGSHTVVEGDAAGYSHVGWIVLNHGVCGDHGANDVIASGTGATANVPVGTDNVIVCFTNTATRTIKVHITKYLDGSQATAQTANNYAFPMSATWTASNLNGGVQTSGNYTLDPTGHGGSDPYAADTAPMTVGANYTTSETLSTSCTAGQPYRLVGYKTDSSSFPTSPLGASMTPPSFTNLQADQYITVFNVSCSGHLTLNKIVNNDNGGDANSQSFTPSIDNSQTSWGTSNQVTPGSHTIAETNLPGYTGGSWTCSPENALTGNSQVNVPAGGNVTCTITNTSQKAHIIVKKVYVLNGGTKEAPTIDVNGSQIAGPNGTGDATHDNWDQVDVTAGLVTVAETLPNSNWLQTGVTFSEGCNVHENEKLTIDILDLISVELDIPGEQVYPGPGETCTVTFTNTRQTGTVVVKKVVESGSSVNPNDPNPAFTGLFDGNSWGNLQNGGSKTFTDVLSDSGHSITEAAGTVNFPGDSQWVNDGFFAGNSDGVCPTAPAELTPLTPGNITVAAGQTTTICVLNRRNAPDVVTANVFVYKVIVGSFASTTDTFTGSVSSPKGGGNFSITTLNGASFPLSLNSDVPNTTFSVTEAAKAGYTTLGYKVVEGNAACPAADGNYLSSVTNHAIGLASSAAYTVCVYNDPRVSINVHKTEQNGAASINGQGWNVTVSGCGITPKQAVTDANGNASFTNLPLCNSYVVSEDINSKGVGAYTPANGFPTSVVVNATTAGGTSTVLFSNVKFINPCAFNNCNPVIINTPTTPSATPTTPTATATTPTQKPTEPTKTEKPEEPKKTPTVDIILGEKTPGANATPLAPQTGSGLFGTGKSGSNLLLAVLGIFSLSAGFAVIAVANKNKSRS